MLILRGQAAVVTGAARGIGAAIARALSAEGVKVVICDIDVESAQAVASALTSSGGEAIAIGCDVTSRASVEGLASAAWDAFGRVDIAVNNAGVIGQMGDLVDASEEDARWVLETNVLGVWNGCSVFGRRFSDQGSPAHILNTGSENSIGVPIHGAGLYTASKHAILGLSDVLRRELPDFVGVSILCPGSVPTELTGAANRRPERFGGPEGETPTAMSGGMSAEHVAQRALSGIKNGDFYIMTHPPAVAYAEERWEEISAAFADQAPRYEGDEVLNTRGVAAAYLEQLKRATI